jgi:small nuclear ribonucleoprotein (snRNP)-like protein
LRDTRDVGMLNMNRFLSEQIGKEVVIKLKIGLIRWIIQDVGNEGSLIVGNIQIIDSHDKTLKEWEDRSEVVIRKDSIVAVFLE